MSKPIEQRSRPRSGIIGLLFVLTFLAGLALAAYGGRRLGWFAPPLPVATVQPAIPQRPAPVVSAPTADLATLGAREVELASRLAELEARTSRLTGDALAAGAQAGRAESVLVLAAARRALDRGVSLGNIEEQLRLRFDPTHARAVEIVTLAARQPVTLEDLRLAFAAIAPDLQTAASGGAVASIRRELGALIVLRRAGTPSPHPAERTARARRLLDAGQVEAAVAEARTLPGAARADNWFGAAGRYIQARRALDVLEDAAIVATGAPI